MQPLILQRAGLTAARLGRPEPQSATVSASKPSVCGLGAGRADSHSQASTSSSTAGRASGSCVRMVPSAVAERMTDTQPASFTTVPVDLGDRSYPIHIGSDLLQEGHKLAAMVTGSTALIVTNATIAPLYLQRFATACQRLNTSGPE